MELDKSIIKAQKVQTLFSGGIEVSWSISMIGKPENVVKALKEHSVKETGQSKVEYDDALPHLVALVEQNFAKEGSGYNTQLIDLEASGSGVSRNNEQMHRSCMVTIKSHYKTLV